MFQEALAAWQSGARELGTETVISLLVLWVAATLGGLEIFLTTCALVVFYHLVRNGYSRRMAENFTDVYNSQELYLCRLILSEDQHTGHPTATVIETSSGRELGHFQLLVSDAQVEPLIASQGEELERFVKYQHLDGRGYMLILDRRFVMCAISTRRKSNSVART